jgi:hypothetical protein
MPDSSLTYQCPRTGVAAGIAAALGFARRDGRGWKCHCPICGGRNLSVSDGDLGLLVYCWSGQCNRVDILRELRRLGLLDDGPRREDRPRERKAAPAKPQPDWDKLNWLLKRLQPIEGTPAEIYLRNRGLDLPPDGHHLRFLPPSPPKHSLPCMVGIVTAIADASCVLTLHFTKLRPDGSARAERSFFASFPKKGGVIRLCDDADVDVRLGVAEGIETSLAVATAFQRRGWFMPVWAALDAGNLGALPVVPGIETLVIYADAGAAGEKAANDLCNRWVYAGRDVRVAIAPHDDWNAS